MSLLEPELHLHNSDVTKRQYIATLLRDINDGQSYILCAVGDIQGSHMLQQLSSLNDSIEAATNPLRRSNNATDLALLEFSKNIYELRLHVSMHHFDAVDRYLRTNATSSLSRHNVAQMDKYLHCSIGDEIARLELEIINVKLES